MLNILGSNIAVFATLRKEHGTVYLSGITITARCRKFAFEIKRGFLCKKVQGIQNLHQGESCGDFIVRIGKVNYYCMVVKTGKEEAFRLWAAKMLADGDTLFAGQVLFFKKLMRTKKGKIYDEAFFPGYVFLETDCTDASLFSVFRQNKDFYYFLPKDDVAQPLSGLDYDCVMSLRNYGETIGFTAVKFDENDRIVITGGPFKNLSGTVVAVNRRNHRVNIRLDVFNRATVVGLTYYDIKKEDWSKEEKDYLKNK